MTPSENDPAYNSILNFAEVTKWSFKGIKLGAQYIGSDADVAVATGLGYAVSGVVVVAKAGHGDYWGATGTAAAIVPSAVAASTASAYAAEALGCKYSGVLR